MFFDFVAFATRPDRLILEAPLLAFDLLEEGPFFYGIFFVIFEDFISDCADFDA